MKTIGIYALVSVIGYFIGSVSFARLIFAWKKPGEKAKNIRSVSTDSQVEVVAHQIGATNVMMVFGRKWGLTTMVMDVAKGFLPVLILHLVYPEAYYHLVIGVFILMGHLWPVWYKFKGGGGYSSILGMMLAISPVGLVVTQVGGALMGKWNQRLLFLSGIVLMIPWFMFRDGLFSPEVLFALIITVSYLLGQLPEIIEVKKLMSQGHVFDRNQVVNMMKHASKMGQEQEVEK